MPAQQRIVGRHQPFECANCANRPRARARGCHCTICRLERFATRFAARASHKETQRGRAVRHGKATASVAAALGTAGARRWVNVNQTEAQLCPAERPAEPQ